MAKVTGLGGVFFKARDPEALRDWYAVNLGIEISNEVGGATFRWRDLDDPAHFGTTIWAPFRQDTSYFSPSRRPFMINYRVDDLLGLLARLEQAGVATTQRVEQHPQGRFAWLMDPEGNRIELWEPNKAPA